ncbi:MAG: hypothetical protein EOO92_02950 [Pedobacter sp.]|nr:MAG: hypothetical protein EOO92_02950 [Pedobacter sp.]
MAIYTRSGNFRKGYDPSIVWHAPKGYDQTRIFYAPQYGNPLENNTVPDFRSTIYWNPAVLTKEEGQTKVSYYNADQVGSYRVIVEGIDSDGRLGRKVYRYKVE